MTQKNYNNIISLFPILLFPVIPFLSVLLFAVFLVTFKTVKNSIWYLFFIILSFYLGLINSTKIPESDLANYYSNFLEVKNYSFIEYILLNGKEPVFYSFNYITYHITNGNTSLYIIISTAIAYMFFFTSILKFFRAMSISKNTIVFAIILAAFFPQLFSLSAHLNRQFIAASIMMYALVQKIQYNRTVWPYLLLAIFTHSTAILFVPLVYLKILNRKFSVKIILILLLILGSISFLIPVLGKIISLAVGNNFLTYALLRAARGTTKELEPLGLLSFIVLGILILVVLFSQYLKNSTRNQGFMHFSNVFLIFSAFILLNLHMTELSVRFFFYTYFFFPFLFPLIIKSNKPENIYIRFMMSTLMILFFFYRIEYGTWTYAPLKELLFNNVFNFL